MCSQSINNKGQHDTFNQVYFTNSFPKNNNIQEQIEDFANTSISIDDSKFFETSNSSLQIHNSEFDNEIDNSLKFYKENIKSEFLPVNTGESLDHSELLLSSKHYAHINLFTRFEKLSHWGLPNTIINNYKTKKITSMFPWQVECLSRKDFLHKNQNLVYSAPTSAGKTLIAEIIAIKTVLERNKKVLVILPFVSVVREKLFYFQEIFEGSGVRIDGFMGAYTPPGGFESIQIAICTIEKANSLVNKLLQEKRITDIGAIIVDELHLLGDSSRGYLLELLLSKIIYICKKDPSLLLQIIGMSATLPNLKDLAKWLNSDLYVTDFRPIPLVEHAIVNNKIVDKKLSIVREIIGLSDIENDSDFILQLSLETIFQSCSVLIFCPTKNWCETLAVQIAQAFWNIGRKSSETSIKLCAQLNLQLINEVLEQLKFSVTGLDSILKKTIPMSVAFHHAGLTMDERDIIENGFKMGGIRVLVATSTLSSGVNLPAKRVIIRTPFFYGGCSIDIITYKQMIGRAGRMGKDTSGESILIFKEKDANVAKKLMSGVLESIKSCLNGEGRLKRAILEVVASNVANTAEDIELFTKCTLFSLINNEIDDKIEETINFLSQNEFITKHHDCEKIEYFATNLGKACLSSSLPPEDGLALLCELEKARECFVLETELHLIYLVTPYSACNQWPVINWIFYLNIWEELPKSMKKVGELVGIREGFILQANRGTLPKNHTSNHKLLIHKRFLIALALHDLVNERALSEVSKKFNCPRGLLQSLQVTSSTFAGMMTNFTRELGWTNVEILIEQFQKRLHFGITRDLLDLMRIPFLNGKNARALFNSNIKSLVDLAKASVKDIEAILSRIRPFETEKKITEDFQTIKRNRFKNVWIVGKEGLNEREAAKLLIEEARNFIMNEMGVNNVNWDKNFQEFCLQQKNDEINKSNKLKCSNETNKKILTKINNDAEDDCCYTLNKLSIRSEKKRSRPSVSPEKKEIKRKKKKFHRQNKVSNRFATINLVDVGKSLKILNMFESELEEKSSISLSIDTQIDVKEKIPTIGLHINESLNKNDLDKTSSSFISQEHFISGLCICWGTNTVYYLCLNKTNNFLELIKRFALKKTNCVRIFTSLNVIKQLKQFCALDLLNANIIDPLIGDWIFRPGEDQRNLLQLILFYCPWLVNISDQFKMEDENKVKASYVAFLNWHLSESVTLALSKESSKLLRIFFEEMNLVGIIAQIELNGFSVNYSELEIIGKLIRQYRNNVEKKIYNLAGCRFSIGCQQAVIRILGLSRTSKANKEVLSNCANPISRLIIEWRRISGILSKMIQPIQKRIHNGSIFGNHILNTLTGRISMSEPNLQNIAKEFEIVDPISLDKTIITCRDIFCASNGFILLSADYCQLELRILTHLSQETLLCKIMHTKKDVFQMIAAEWSKIPESKVDEELRHRVKCICYGIIYGMGAKAISNKLKITELEAFSLIDTFNQTYPGLKIYSQEVIKNCQITGYVETITGRRRYLPKINSIDMESRKQAERQAINTTIQGSAADLVKKCMIALNREYSKFGVKLVLHLHDELIFDVPKDNIIMFAKTIKEVMENSMSLSIPFPIKLKKGDTWGKLTEFTNV